MSAQPTCSLLVIEDNPADVALLRYALTTSALPVALHAVKDGVEALAFLQQQGQYATAPRPQVLLLDLNLPKKPGHAVLAEIKTHPQLKQLPVIILSSSANSEDIARSYALGANAYLIKPLELDDYLRVVQHFVQFWCQSVALPSRVTPEDCSGSS